MTPSSLKGILYGLHDYHKDDPHDPRTLAGLARIDPKLSAASRAQKIICSERLKRSSLFVSSSFRMQI
jgi:hypothetical protein